MKKIIGMGLIIAVLLISSCVTFPQPENETDSLVVGNFQLDFPDGFFRFSARTVGTNVKLNFRNISTNEKFIFYTKSGWYYFPYNGQDEIILESYQYEAEMSSSIITMAERPLGIKIPKLQGKVIYLGHLTMVYSSPSSRVSDSNSDTFNYEMKLTSQKNIDDVKQFIGSRDENSPWLSTEIVSLLK